MIRSKIFWAIVAGIFIGEIGSMLMPFQIGALMDGLHLGEAAAGGLGTVETVTVGVVMLAIAVGLIKVAPVRLAISGAILVVIGQFLTAAIESYSVLVFARIVVGVGCAFCQSAAVMTIASKYSDPDAVTGKVYAFVIMILAVFIFVIPSIVTYGSHHLLFTTLAIISICTLPLLRFLSNNDEVSSLKVVPKLSIPVKYIILFFTGELFLLVGFGAVWAFVERIGLSLDISAQTVGIVLSGSMLVSMTGSFVAGVVGGRIGRLLPLSVGSILGGVSCATVAFSSDISMYIISMVFFQFLLSFVLPYLIGTAASIDRSGRLATAAFAVQIFSYGVGTGLGGHVAEISSLQSLGWIGLFAPVTAGIIFIPLCRFLDNKSKKSLANLNAY